MSRALAEILLDLEEVRRDCTPPQRRPPNPRAHNDSAAEDEAGDEMSQLDRRQDDLRDEFRSVFKAVTGVAWSNIEAATVSGAI
jgi:hypothetical protein